MRVGPAGPALVLFTLASGVLQAQVADPVGPVAIGGTPDWTEAWSPLVPLGELPRTIRPRPKTRRNEPANLSYVLTTVAACLGMTEGEIAAATTATAIEFFELG